MSALSTLVRTLRDAAPTIETTIVAVSLMLASRYHAVLWLRGPGGSLSLYSSLCRAGSEAPSLRCRDRRLSLPFSLFLLLQLGLSFNYPSLHWILS